VPYVILGIALLVLLLLAGRWYVRTPPQTLFQVLKWTAVSFVVLLGGYLAVTGRLGWALFAVPALLPLFQRLRQTARMSKTFSRMGQTSAGMGTGQTSEVNTKFVRMVLDHDTGEMNGDILVGRYAGRTLRNLSIEELLALLAEARDDVDSVQVLTAYLDRYHGEDWRARAAGGASQGAGRQSSSTMSPDEAYEILGVKPGADAAAIKAAHHRLMSKIHPDHGGSTYLAAKINQAKDLLLDR
jgi:hypothetical protein